MENQYKNIFIEGAISPQKIADSISKHSHKTNIGAHGIFLGQVRADVKENATVIAISYSAYTDMALKRAHELREAIFEKYQLTCLHIYHSIGLVKAGEICLFVFTSSPHRHDATNACNELVEQIKTELPIWGKEILSNNDAIWKINTK